jgi:hypothetical protein
VTLNLSRYSLLTGEYRLTLNGPYWAVDESAKGIIGMEVTTADWHDSDVCPDLLAQVEGKVALVSANGAYDTAGSHAAITGRDGRKPPATTDAVLPKT